MSELGHLVAAQCIKRSIPSFGRSKTKSHKLQSPFQTSKTVITASKRKDFTRISKRSSSAPRRLITISTAGGRWNGDWTCDYLLSLHDLRLDDLVEDDEQKDALVSINLCVQKHASFGLSVNGRIITSFTRRCSNCSSPYCREIDTSFNVWVLSSSRNSSSTDHLPEVIYVKPGYEADLDSLIQDTIRLTSSVKDTCSESCEKSETTFQCISGQNAASIDKRWSRLLELKKAEL